MDDDDYTIETLPACEMQVIDVVIVVLDTARRFLADMTELVCSHANFKVQQKRMIREASAEIESIIQGDM